MARTITTTDRSPPRTIRRSPPAQRHPSSSVGTPTTATNTTTTANRSLALQRAAERPNIPIAPASSNTSSPIYSTTSSPPISPGISQHHLTTLGTMAPSTRDSRSTALALELAPASTPTGRISKAKKGKRVHACEFPGCGKIFTRAEHRRRHELNHNPDATYRCSQQGCGKSFHRLDLLQRHQERHELEASTQPSSPIRRYPSQSAPLPEPPNSIPTTTMSSPPISQIPARTSAGGMSIPDIIHHNPYHPGANTAAAFGMASYMPLFTSAGDWDPVYVTEAMHSPHTSTIHRSSVSAPSSVAGFENGSPMVTAALPHWAQVMPPNTLHDTMFQSDGMSPYPSLATVNATNIPLSELDGYEWDYIRRELSAMSLPSTRSGLSDTLRWHCIERYWQCFHPTYPIVHRPTFLIGTQPPPLLTSAMVAIGSFYDTEPDAKEYSLALLEIATKLLRGRPSAASKTGKARIVDLQTVVLLEILSTFCARQISVQKSTNIRWLFANLNSTAIKQPLCVFRSHKGDHDAIKLVAAHRFWIEEETRSRIFNACSILDSQRTVLFEQNPTVRKNNNLRVDTAISKPVYLPCDDELWNASPIEVWADIAQKHEYIQLIGGKPPITPGSSTGYSYFQQQVINAHSGGQLRGAPAAKDISVISDEVLSKSEFDFHASRMCKHTPVRHLLTVTGESWFLGQKVEKKADYDHARTTLRKWLEESPTSKKASPDSSLAHWHALKLLRIVQVDERHRGKNSEIFGTTHLLHENWVVFLASLVCWIQGQRKASSGVTAYNHQRVPGTQRLVDTASERVSTTDGVTVTVASDATISHSCLNDPVRAAQEAETYLIFTNVSDPAALRDLEPSVLSRTQGLLESVRSQKITKHMMGGLMNDAEQVLFRLVDGSKKITF